MRLALIAVLTASLCACASFGRAPITDLTPVFTSAAAYDGRVFEGEMVVVKPFPQQPLHLATSLQADSFISMDEWSARRLENYHRFSHGHRIRIRAIIREDTIVLTEAAAPGTCAPLQTMAAFYLEQVQVLRGPDAAS